MGLHKIFKIVAAILSLIGAIFLALIISKGDTALEAAYQTGGDTSLIDNMSYIAYVILALVLAFVVFFVVKNLVTHTSSLKSTLIGVGVFIAILVISYALTGGDPRVYSHSEGIATEKASHLVGAGLVAFYILGTIAILSMLLTGVKKFIK
ncbi:MAG: hypothetical protein IMY67_00780 [Bacteroidetes bacterium]|nr:hypothetical protein [Bacteroidota bacterium]